MIVTYHPKHTIIESRISKSYTIEVVKEYYKLNKLKKLTCFGVSSPSWSQFFIRYIRRKWL